MSTSKKVRLTTDRVNAYGYRVLTSGIDIEQYRRNPVLLWMHRRGEVIGHLDNIEVDADGITGELVFDEASERGREVAAQWEAESLRMVSVGLEIIETSDAPADIEIGQTRPTVTRSKLLEVSVVDIGANDDALRLSHNGETITLGEGGDAVLPLLPQPDNLNTNDMTLREQIIEALGLETTAADSDVVDNIRLLVSMETDYADTLARYEELRLETVTAEVDSLVQRGVLATEGREAFIALGVQDRNALRLVTQHVRPAHVSAIEQLNVGEQTPDKATLIKEWDDLDRQNLLFDLRTNDPQKFQTLFEAKFKN